MTYDPKNENGKGQKARPMDHTLEPQRTRKKEDAKKTKEDKIRTKTKVPNSLHATVLGCISQHERLRRVPVVDRLEPWFTRFNLFHFLSTWFLLVSSPFATRYPGYLDPVHPQRLHRCSASCATRIVKSFLQNPVKRMLLRVQDQVLRRVRDVCAIGGI